MLIALSVMVARNVAPAYLEAPRLLLTRELPAR